MLITNVINCQPHCLFIKIWTFWIRFSPIGNALCCRLSLYWYLHNIRLKLVSIPLNVTNLVWLLIWIKSFNVFFREALTTNFYLTRILQTIEIKDCEYLKAKSKLHRHKFILKHLIHSSLLYNHYPGIEFP